MNKKPLKIFIAEWVPSLNKGELAILEGMMRTFEVLGNTQVSVLSFYPEIDKSRYPQEIDVINAENDLYLGNRFPERSLIIRLLLSIFVGFQHLLFISLFLFFHENSTKIMRKKVWREYIEADIIIFGHDQIDCAIGFYLLFHPILIILLKKIVHKKVVIYGNGISSSKLTDLLLPFVLLNVDLITTREESTYHFYKKIVLGSVPLFFTADPAILVKPSDADRVNSILNKENIIIENGFLIGLAISRQVLEESLYEQKNPEFIYSQRIKLLAEFIDQLIIDFNAHILFLPHCVEPYRNLDDRVIAKDVYNLVKNKQKVYKIDNEYTPQELKGLMSKLDILISTRIHAMVNAASMCIPFICLKRVQDTRAHGILAGLFEQGDWILNINDLTLNELYQKTIHLLSLKNEVKKDLSIRIEKLEKKAMLNGVYLKKVCMYMNYENEYVRK